MKQEKCAEAADWRNALMEQHKKGKTKETAGSYLIHENLRYPSGGFLNCFFLKTIYCKDLEKRER